MRPRVLTALAVADFRERVRRPAYVVVLLAAVCLGYLAAPATDAHWTIVNSGAYRGVYNSAYIGSVTALAGALWLSTGGFYVIRTAIARDRQSGVGQLLAATPMRNTEYLLGKFLSNLLVLGSMAGVLAGTAVAMQLARGESRAVDPIALLSPFVLFTLPVLGVAAAAAVFFESTPVLRGGLGNVIWLFVSLVGAIVGQSANAPLGGLGMSVFADSLRGQLAARDIALTDVALGLMYLEEPPRAVLWSGVDFTAVFAGERALLLLLAAAAAVVPSLWFRRFDPARAVVRADPAPHPSAAPAGGTTRPPATGHEPWSGIPGPSAAALPPTTGTSLPPETAGRRDGGVPLRPAGREHAASAPHRGTGSTPRHGTAAQAEAVAEPVAAPAPAASPHVAGPQAAVRWQRRGTGAFRVMRGELRILTRGVSRWWWLAAAALVVAGVAAPAAARPLLMAAWIWPVLVWSRLGAQAREDNVEVLLAACPSPVLRTLAQWLAGVVLTGTVGLGSGLTLAVDGHLAEWLAGVAFIPALALAVGVASRTQRFFQAVYPLLWYMVVNDLSGLDYMGVLAGGPAPLTVAGVAAALLLSALGGTAFRHRYR